MGFVLIRHSSVEHRRVNMDRVPKILCVLVRLSERVGEVGERGLVLTVSVRCGKKMRHDTWMIIVLGHKDVQS